jgi:hypothetical protein
MKPVENLQSYQNETRACRDKKVKEKSIKVRDLVLLRSPCMEASIKLEPKWLGPRFGSSGLNLAFKALLLRAS